MLHGHIFEFDDPYNLQATLRAGNEELFPLGNGETGHATKSSLLTFDDPYAYQAAGARGGEVEFLVTEGTKASSTPSWCRSILDRLWMQQGYDSLPRLARTVNRSATCGD